MRTILPTPGLLPISALACLAAACSGGGDSARLTSSSGELSLSLFDSPSTEVSEIWLKIDSIRVQPANEGAVVEFDLDPDLDVDLLTLTADAPLLLLDGERVPARDYDWLEIVLRASFDTIADSYVVQRVGGGAVELNVPGQVVRLDGDFTIPDEESRHFILDWDTRQGLIDIPGDLGYTLLPAVRVIDAMAHGTLRGTVAMSLITPATPSNLCNADSPLGDPAIGNVVYVYAGSGRTPDDIDGIAAILDPNVDPVTTTAVVQDNAGTYRYATLLPTGEYTLAFTCQAGLDDPLSNDVMLFSLPIDTEILVGEETVVDF